MEKTRGRRGEVLVSNYSGAPERFVGLSVTLQPGGWACKIESAWLHDGRLVLKFAGIDTIGDAEGLRNLDVCIPISERITAEPGEFFLSDLVGCALVEQSTGRTVGIVSGWQETGGPILLEAGDLLIPFARAICRDIDVAARRIVVDLPEGLKDLNSP